MTVEELVNLGIQYGIDFPDIYDWTFGEIVNYIKAKKEANRKSRQEDALLLFKTASLVARFSNGTSGQKISMMKEFDYLYNDEEKIEARKQEVLRSFRRIDGKVQNR